MKKALEWIYTATFDLEEENLAEILHAASLMQLNPMIEKCKQHMFSHMSAKNCYLYLRLATLYSFDTIIAKVNSLFLQNFDQLSLQSEFLQFKVDKISSMKKILKIDKKILCDYLSMFVCNSFQSNMS